MTDTGWFLIALAIGIVIGALVVWLMNRKAAGPSHSVKALREESEKFRDEVNDHFVETAELINNLTDSYKKVFDHLSEGAERLVDEKVLRERMPEVSDQEIRLKRIGQTVPRSAAVAESTSEKDPQAAAEQAADAEEVDGVSAPESETKAETAQAQEKPERMEAKKTTEEEADQASEVAEDRENAKEETAASADRSDPESKSKMKSSEPSSEESPEDAAEQAKKTS